jgi:hypothetical protein
MNQRLGRVAAFALGFLPAFAALAADCNKITDVGQRSHCFAQQQARQPAAPPPKPAQQAAPQAQQPAPQRAPRTTPQAAQQQVLQGQQGQPGAAPRERAARPTTTPQMAQQPGQQGQRQAQQQQQQGQQMGQQQGQPGQPGAAPRERAARPTATPQMAQQPGQQQGLRQGQQQQQQQQQQGQGQQAGQQQGQQQGQQAASPRERAGRQTTTPQTAQQPSPPAPPAASAHNPFAKDNAQKGAGDARAGAPAAAGGAGGAGKVPSAPGSGNPFATGNAQTSPSPGSQRSQAANAGNSPRGGPAPVYKPGPDVKTTTLANGSMMHTNPKTRTSVSTDSGGRITTLEKPGLKATAFRSDGRAAHIERTRADGSRMVVDRGYRDVRRVEVVRPGGVRVVTVGQRGYVERPYRQGYVSRTYVYGGRTNVYVYRTGYYRNYPYYAYVPGIVYRPAFYGWAVRPWGVPVAYAWAPAPWIGYYSAYYVPAPTYPAPSYWIADYMMAATLAAAYEAQMAAAAGAYQQPVGMAPMSPQVRDMLADQVRQQIEMDQLAAANSTPQVGDGIPSALDPRYRVFVVNQGLDVVSTANGQVCGLTPGDVLQRNSETVASDGTVSVMVLSSKSPECPASFQTAVELATLQDMHNQFRENVAAALDKLATTSGTNGIPIAPPANPQAYAEGQAPPDEQARNLVLAQFKEADQAEEEVKLASGSAI